MTSRKAALRDTCIVISIALIAYCLHQLAEAQKETVQTIRAMNAEVIKVAEDARSAHNVPPPTPAIDAFAKPADPR